MSSAPPRPPRVVTLGGGHGQSAVLAALCELTCEITAVVSVADDGGCSGQLREELGMPPPGDLRRCLTTLARNRKMASRFEVRLAEHGAEGRSAGNLALSEAYHEFGSLQKAVDWAADLLQCRGRVVPAAETEGVLMVYDMIAGEVAGETNVEARASSPMVAVVHGPEHTNPAAAEAILAADLILIGPGSFVTSTLATLTTAQVAEAVAAAPGRRVMLHNLGPEGDQLSGSTLEDYVRLLADHLVIASGGETADFTVLQHGADFTEQETASGTLVLSAPLAHPGRDRVHAPELVAQALTHWFGLVPRVARSIPAPPGPQTVRTFEDRVVRAKQRIRGRPPGELDDD